MTGRRTWPVAVAGLALVVTSPVLTWEAVGDLSLQGYTQLDYAVRPPRLGPGTTLALGLSATLVGLTALAVLVLAFVERWVRPGWLLVVGPLVLVGVLAGLVGRVMTAGVIGANIGAGLAAMAFVPVALMLVGLAGGACVFMLRGRHPV
ncbi:hypothetical protein ABH931_006181 [Streptacidiphilus sp. MAP12-33]|uniref:hypothetical protein n=1 Tax=Streptacidiphilus sp. MAP12-33 TaxID=3156266 RepID=UPI00351157D3